MPAPLVPNDRPTTPEPELRLREDEDEEDGLRSLAEGLLRLTRRRSPRRGMNARASAMANRGRATALAGAPLPPRARTMRPWLLTMLYMAYGIGTMVAAWFGLPMLWAPVRERWADRTVLDFSPNHQLAVRVRREIRRAAPLLAQYADAHGGGLPETIAGLPGFIPADSISIVLLPATHGVVLRGDHPRLAQSVYCDWVRVGTQATVHCDRLGPPDASSDSGTSPPTAPVVSP
jgi:hypothetical protein